MLLIVGIYSCYDDVNRFFFSIRLFFKKWRKLHYNFGMVDCLRIIKMSCSIWEVKGVPFMLILMNRSLKNWPKSVGHM